MLANSLTKGHEKWQLELYSKDGCKWRSIYSGKYESAKRRKMRGLPALAVRDESKVEKWGSLDEKPDGT